EPGRAGREADADAHVRIVVLLGNGTDAHATRERLRLAELGEAAALGKRRARASALPPSGLEAALADAVEEAVEAETPPARSTLEPAARHDRPEIGRAACR